MFFYISIEVYNTYININAKTLPFAKHFYLLNNIFYFKLLYYLLKNKLYILIKYEFNGDWGLRIGDWGLGIGDWAQSPIPNPQSPNPNPQTP